MKSSNMIVALVISSCIVLLVGGTDEKRKKGEDTLDYMNDYEIIETPQNRFEPPPRDNILSVSRYIMHKGDWGLLTTSSTRKTIAGYPFPVAKIVADGPHNNSTGIPYFFMSLKESTTYELTVNSKATFTISIEKANACLRDLENKDTRCAVLVLKGKIQKVTLNKELNFATTTLLDRHKDIENTGFPPDHEWFVTKLKISEVALLNNYGEEEYIPVNDYLKYDTGGAFMW